VRGSPERKLQDARAVDVVSNAGADADGRAAPRFTLLIRTAKLVMAGKQHLCVIRDVSTTGASIRTFHSLIESDAMEIHLDTGQQFPVEQVWQKESEAGFQFLTPIEVNDVVRGTSKYPRRDLRFEIEQEVSLLSRGQKSSSVLKNLSRQGGLIECAEPLALAQSIKIEGDGFPDVEARVRWRKNGHYGLAFDTTFSLTNLALLIRDLHKRQKMFSECVAESRPKPA